MKTRAILLFMIAAAFVSFVMPSSSFACTQPPNYPAAALHLQLWPAYAGVGVMVNNVPNAPVTTAIGNWNKELNVLCGPYFQFGTGYFYSVAMSFTALAPPPNCPSGSICFTRGLTTMTNWDGSGRLKTATMQINNTIASTAAQTEVIAHEFGHTMGLDDCNYPSCAPGSSVMENNAKFDVNGSPVTGVNSIVGQPGPTICDFNAVITGAPDYICPTSCPQNCTPNWDNGDTTNPVDFCLYPATGCQPGYQADGATGCCQVYNVSPILIDTTGSGFYLTDVKGGVLFDMAGTGHPIHMGWTAPGADNAFLALPGVDGLIHSGKQLFGNFTAQPKSDTPNGFAALAVYDLPANGGNGDGVIDSKDAIFSSLRLWVDANHDGISQPEEMYTLPELGVNSISLSYKADQRTDQWGNVFHYHAQVNPGDATTTGRIAYDVYFVHTPGAPVPTAKKYPTCPVPSKKVGMLAPAGKR